MSKIIDKVFRYRTTIKFTMRIIDNWAERESMTIHFSPALNSGLFPDEDALRRKARRQALREVSRLTGVSTGKLRIAIENPDGYMVELRGK